MSRPNQNIGSLGDSSRMNNFDWKSTEMTEVVNKPRKVWICDVYDFLIKRTGKSI